jgi:hypothetical protein
MNIVDIREKVRERERVRGKRHGRGDGWMLLGELEWES